MHSKGDNYLQQTQLILSDIIGSGQIWLDFMKLLCGDTANLSMLDLGCYKAPYTSQLGFKQRVYVDIQDRPLDHLEEQQYFVQADCIRFLEKNKTHYDIMIASDLIEHLRPFEGFYLKSLMEISSDKQIFFTPLGPYLITDDSNPDSHHSAWIPEMFPEYLCIVLPDFHPQLKTGAFFAVNCSEKEKERIKNEISFKYEQNRAN